jgi:hypothetical protein
MSRMAAASDGGAVRSVPVTSIDAFCERHRIAPDFIKIDIEGWELAALRGARRTIRDRGPALALFVEFHPAVWPLIGTSRAQLEAELERQGLDLVPLASGVDPWSLEGMCVRLRARDARR